MSGISLNGIASGLDTAKMIEELMKLERRPLNALETRHSSLEEKKSVIRELNTKLSALRNAASDLMYSSTFNLTSSSVSDSTVIKVTSTDAAAVNSYSVEVSQLAKKHVVASGEFAVGGNVLTALAQDGKTISFSGKGETAAKEITLRGETDDEILNNLMQDINSADVGIRASIMETSPGHKTLVLTSVEFGEDAGMVIGTNADPGDKRTFINADQDVLTGLGLAVEDNGTLKLNAKQEAQNAIVIVNGIEIVHGDNTLDGVIQGVTIDLLNEGTTSFDIAKDHDRIAEKVQKFVDAYNETVELIRKHSAKDGLLQGDSTLRSLQDELAGMLNAQVAGNTAYKYLVTIGLEVDKGITSGSEMTGKISFDREKFIQALTEHPDEVYRLFAHDDESPANKDGIGLLFNQRLLEWTRFGTGLLAYKVDGYDHELKNVAEQMENMERRLKMKEEQMLRQFANMEVMLSSLHNEQAWLTSQLNSLMTW